MDVVRLFLPDPQQLVDRALPVGAAERQNRELLRQIVAVDDAEFFDSVRACPVLPVRPDGKISTPLVNDVVAVGKSPAQLSKDIEAVLGEYIRSPQVSVIVLQARSAYSEVRVVGEVLRPQAVPYRSGMTVLDVVLAVGGLNPYAAGNRAKLIRRENGRDTEIRIKLEDLLNDGEMNQNVPVKPGDVLVVPQSRW